MTLEELNKVKFHLIASTALENVHFLTYASEDGRLGICDRVPKNTNGRFGKPRRHYRIDDKVYKTKKAFEEAIKDFNPSV